MKHLFVRRDSESQTKGSSDIRVFAVVQPVSGEIAGDVRAKENVVAGKPTKTHGRPSYGFIGMAYWYAFAIPLTLSVDPLIQKRTFMSGRPRGTRSLVFPLRAPPILVIF